MPADLYPTEAQLQTPVQADGQTETGNSFGRGLAILLRHAGCQTDYPTVMGDLGQAFVTQGAEYDEALTGGYADVGWWPLDLWQMEGRLAFLADAAGCELTCQRVDFSEISPDPEAGYGKHFEETVRTEIADGKPLLSVWTCGFVVTGYDGGDPPLLGWCLAAGQAESMRADDYPASLYTYAGRFDPMERREADRAALAHAVDLGRGTAPTRGLWVTGPRAWKGWQDHLLKAGANTQSRWHANMRLQLVASRRCALDYLAAMARRRGEEASRHLRDAIEVYGLQIECLTKMMIDHEEIVDPGRGREALAASIREAAGLDARAIGALERAVAAMGQ